MTTLATLLDVLERTGTSARPQILEGDTQTSISQIHLVDDISGTSATPREALVILDRSLSSVATTYRLDVAIRHASRNGSAGVAFFGDADAPVSLSARRLARKTETCLVVIPPDMDVSVLLSAMSRHTTDEIHLTVERAREASRSLSSFEEEVDSADSLIALTSAVLGRNIDLDPSDGDENLIAVPAFLTDETTSWLTVDRTDTDQDTLLELLLWRLAGALTRRRHAALRAEEMTRQSTGEVLLQMIDSTGATLADLAPRARRLGVNVDGWHIAIHLDLDDVGIASDDEVAVFEVRDRLLGTSLQVAFEEPGSWHAARDPSRIVLLWTGRSAPDSGANLRFQRLAERIVDRLATDTSGVRLFCGVGTPRSGLSGIPATASEARTASTSARARDVVNTAVSFDVIGLQRTVVEWFGAPSVREAIDVLLAPLDELTEQKRDVLLDTLTTYLDNHGSIARTAEALFLHRNAVRYRLDQIVDLLDIDMDDADQRLFLHLACRARKLL